MSGHRDAYRFATPQLLMISAALCTSAHATERTVDPDVAFVASAGRWESDGSGGSYRVVVRQQGYEHVSSTVVAEGIAAPDDGGTAPRVAFARQLVAPGMVSFGEPRLTAKGDRVRVELKGTHTYAMNEVTCVFELQPGGATATLKPCG